MKKRILFLFIALISFTFSYGQNLSVIYEMKMESDDPQIKGQLGLLNGSEMAIYVKGDLSRMTMDMGGGFISMTTITDNAKKKGMILMDGMMGKQGAYFPIEEPSDSLKKTRLEGIEFLEETKEILGYSCKKAIIYPTEETKVTIWYTDKIQPERDILNGLIPKELNGLPIEIQMKTPQVSTFYTVTDIKDKVELPKGDFKVKIPKGYQEKSLEEFQGIMGALKM